MSEANEAMEALRDLFAFGVPGGRSRVQKRIGKYLDGHDKALDGAPTIKARIDRGVNRALIAKAEGRS